MAKLKILHAPGYGPRASVANLRRIVNTACDSAGTSESGKIAHLFGTPSVTPGYTGVVGHSPTDSRLTEPSLRGDAGDNPMLVKGNHLVLEVEVVKLTDVGLPRKWTPERWGYRVRYEWGDKTVTHINVHFSLRGLHPLRWLKEWQWTKAKIKQAQRRGDYVVVTGDLNSGAVGPLFRELGLKVWRIGIDYLAFDARLFRGKSRTWTPPNVDHPWMVANLHDTKEEAAA